MLVFGKFICVSCAVAYMICVLLLMNEAFELSCDTVGVRNSLLI